MDALRQYGAAPTEDGIELWRRIVFRILISNTDDHLRNHGFLFEGQAGWRLSPVYDVNPVPVEVKERILTTAIDKDNATASLDLALSVASSFGLKQKEAKAVAAEVGRSVATWCFGGLNLLDGPPFMLAANRENWCLEGPNDSGKHRSPVRSSGR